jgi:hypothetical protein
MNKLTFEEWKKEYGLTELTTDSSWFRTDEQYKELLDNQEKNRYEVYCKKVDALNKDPHSDKTYAEAVTEVRTEVLNTINKMKNIDDEVTKDQMWSVIKKLEQVEEKNRCLRVRMYDWLSDLFADWSKRCHEKSVKIDSPCAIKLPDSGKENSHLTNPASWVTPRVTVEEYDNMNNKRIKRR